MSHLASQRSRPVVTTAVLGAVLATTLAGCAEDPPPPPEVVAVETGVSGVADLRIVMPDGVWELDPSVTDAVTTAEGERVEAPEGQVWVVWATEPRGTATVLEDLAAEQTSTELRIEASGTSVAFDPETIPDGALLVPGDGSDAEIVASFDGRDVRYEVTGAELSDSSPLPEVDEVTTVSTISSQRVEDIGPENPYHGGVPASADGSVTRWVPDLGWADDGTVWLSVDAAVSDEGSLLRDADPLAYAEVPLALTSVTATIDGVEHDVPLTEDEESPEGQTDSAGVVAIPDAGELVLEAVVDLGPGGLDTLVGAETVTLTSEPVQLG